MNAASPAFPSPLIRAEQLRRHLPEAFVVDCSHDLAAPEAGAAAFAQGHVPGAVHMHLDRELSGPVEPGSGRHPLPAREALAARLAALGLRRGQPVVAYDRNFSPYAARLWWLLRWLGHAQVAVLDGGWQAWLADGGASESGPAVARPPGDFSGAAQPAMPSIGVDELLAQVLARDARAPSLLVVDARSPERYAGEGETLDPVGGHIPGAVCRFFRDNLQPDGRFLPAGPLREQWNRVLAGSDPGRVVSQCGSGVTACHNLLAMELAGLGGARLYPGSWSQWCSDPRRPVARGATP
ncbi:MAG: sulfurtransferase [Betaproteobacteria bacterium]|nr:sulfurtransferase [Betaproteobacteria bacterium]MBU6512036.1 sulfurtransferase [Betaproteobacteria bacterium]MDE1954795.1 sulfurtransferase [Betaproteobacteria bacterium]MDE2152225.1 sulfurtransferase [Betaproteobacteria bacterium]MDE2477586.1 sulfurtransferase [Betaproteobacteria bacterium]